MKPGDLILFWEPISGWEHGLILELGPGPELVLVLRADGKQVFKSLKALEVVRE